MTSNGFGTGGILQTAALIHIRGIGSDHIEYGTAENGCRFLDVPFHNIHFFLQFIECHTASCHFHAFRLYFQSCEMASQRSAFQQNGQNAGTCTQVQHFFSFFHPCEAAEDHGIHTKTEPFGVLDDDIALAVQVIHPFSLFDQHISPHTASIPLIQAAVSVSSWI